MTASERRFTSLKVAKSASIGELTEIGVFGRRLSCVTNSSWQRCESLCQIILACTDSRYVRERLGETPIAWLGTLQGLLLCGNLM